MSANKFQFTYPILALSHIQKFAIFTSIFIKLVILFDQLTSQACCCCERKGKEGKKKEKAVVDQREMVLWILEEEVRHDKLLNFTHEDGKKTEPEIN